MRGRAYLRIIYGPEYTRHVERLRSRSGAAKRALALREHALGIEGLTRLVSRQPVARRYECAAGVLALESDPRRPQAVTAPPPCRIIERRTAAAAREGGDVR